MSIDLTGKVVAVTGGFGSLGAAVGQTLAAAGANVALLDRADASKAPAHLTQVFAVGEVDLASPNEANAAMAKIVERFGRLDAIVNIAGGFRWEKIEDGSIETWDLLYQMNLRTAVNAARAALPHLLARDAGRVVNIGANAASRAGAGMGAYAASKAGVARFTEALAEELKDRGITVNAVLPSIIDTPANRADMPKADFSRWVKAEQVADLIVFLLSDRAAAITGASIPITGRV
ncbi:MAG TPA: SDR family NAD(P)-dependent oxidoreductase [Burkholderiales bacterium]|nr:SDR family NAD(P)-dependent oxidoreductase [Burkholderiales bacterium]